MKIATRWALGVSVKALSLAACSVGFAGPIGLIDDYSDASLSNYTFYKVLDQGDGTTNVTFASPGGTLDATSVGTSGAEQALFLVNTGVSLGIGEELQVDGPATRVGTANDLGLAIAETPVALAGAGDNRSQADFLFISYRNNNQLNSRGFNGGVEVGQVQNFGVNATKLFIARTGATDVELGWYDGAVRNISRSLSVATADIFNNVGYYADLRNDGGGFTGLDNLQIIPEPASLALAGLGILGILKLRRRSALHG